MLLIILYYDMVDPYFETNLVELFITSVSYSFYSLYLQVHS
jgi:hypothetical protein